MTPPVSLPPHRQALGWLCLSLAASGCALNVVPPSAEVVGIGLTSLGLTSGVAAVELDVWNPNRGDLEVREISYLLEVRGEEDGGEWLKLGDGFHGRPVRLGSQDTTRVSLSVPFEYEGVGAAIRSLLRSGTVQYRVHGEVSLRRWFGDVRVPFAREGVQEF